MLPKLESNPNFYVMQIARAVEPANIQKWIAEISLVINSMGGKSLIPSRISRTEPIFRRSGAAVINEPLDEDMRRGAVNRLKDICVKHEVAAYIVHDVQSAKIAQKLNRSWHAPTIFVCQEYLKVAGFFNKSSSLQNLDSIDHFIVPSETASDHLMTKFRIEKKRISVIREGIDLASISDKTISQERSVSLAQSWGVIENVVEIVLIPQEFANPIWQNSIRHFLDAWEKTGREDVHFVVIGDDEDGNATSKLQSAILKKFPLASIQFVGHCADIEAAIKISSAVVLLAGSPKVSYPIALLAQAIGRYVILPDEASSSEFVNDGVSGAIATSGENSVVDAVAKTIESNEHQRKLSAAAGREYINQNNSRDAMHAALRAVFENDELA